MQQRYWLLFLVICLATAKSYASPGLEFLNASQAPLGNPHDIKLSADGDALYVSDVGNGRIVLLHPDTLVWLGEFGAGQQSGTHDVDYDAVFQQVNDTTSYKSP